MPLSEVFSRTGKLLLVVFSSEGGTLLLVFIPVCDCCCWAKEEGNNVDESIATMIVKPADKANT